MELISPQGRDARPGSEGRRRFATLTALASFALVPWIVLLALTLPHRHVASHWTLTWVGFDVLLLAALVTTSWLAWRRRRVVVLAAFATATLLVCDAWFDVTTARPGADTVIAILTALLLELPLAALLSIVASRVLRAMSRLSLDGAGEPADDAPLRDREKDQRRQHRQSGEGEDLCRVG